MWLMEGAVVREGNKGRKEGRKERKSREGTDVMYYCYFEVGYVIVKPIRLKFKLVKALIFRAWEMELAKTGNGY